MFQIKENKCVSFESKWKVKKVSCANSTQTTEFATQEIGTNIPLSVECEVQTEHTETNKPESAYDMQKLANWLKSVYPTVTREINDANSNFQLFKSYHPTSSLVDPFCKLLQTINWDAGTGDCIPKISALSWNCSGQTLAAAYSYVHSSWCYHTGCVNFYSVGRDEVLNPVANKKLVTSSCVTVICFHSTLPSVIATGSFTGEICIWDIHYEEGQNIIAKINAHEENITQISWINDTDLPKTIVLASSSLDGYLNVWNFSNALQLKQRYVIKPPVFANPTRTASLPDHVDKKGVRGIICFDFSVHIPDMFIVGVEGGLIVQCALSGANTLRGSTADIPILDPVFKYYHPHEGELLGVRFSPNRKDMFMSYATDGEIRIYMVGEDEPSQIIFVENNLSSCMWVPYEKTLIVGCGSRGVIELFDILKGQPILDTIKEKVEPVQLTTMSVNNKRSSVVAIGGNQGSVQIWSCPWNSFV